MLTLDLIIITYYHIIQPFFPLINFLVHNHDFLSHNLALYPLLWLAMENFFIKLSFHLFFSLIS